MENFRMPYLARPLISRKPMEDKLLAKLKEWKVVNLCGDPGSGKSSLAYLIADKFDNVIYITTHGDLEQDFVSRFNLLYGSNFEEYLTCKGCIEYQSYAFENNLLVIDMGPHKEFDLELPQCKGLATLVISRKQINNFHEVDIEPDDEFLRNLFQTKAGERYEGSECTDELLDFAKHSPFVIAQLGRVLSNYPRKHDACDMERIIVKYLPEKTKIGPSSMFLSFSDDHTCATVMKELGII